MKYIMFQQKIGEDSTVLVPIIFPNHLVHADVAKALQSLTEYALTPVSAGDITMHGDIYCSGKSETLGLTTKDTDSTVIMTNDYGGGFVEDVGSLGLIATLLKGAK